MKKKEPEIIIAEVGNLPNEEAKEQATQALRSYIECVMAETKIERLQFEIRREKNAIILSGSQEVLEQYRIWQTDLEKDKDFEVN